MAERVVDLVLERNGQFKKQSCQTERYKIHADSFEDYEGFLNYQKSLLEKYHRKGLTEYDAWYLSTTYGKNSEYIINEALNLDLKFDQALISSEVGYGIKYESLYMPDDFFNRQTGRIYFDIDSVVQNFNFIIDKFSDHYKWSNDQLDEIKKQSQVYLDDVSKLKP